MGLNDLQLSPSVLAALYSSSLVVDEAENTEPVRKAPPAPKLPDTDPKPATGVKYLGNNLQNILIVVSYDNTMYLPDEELNFLTNMLAACKLGLGDVAIVNKQNIGAHTFRELVTSLKTKIILLFGVDPIQMGMPVGFPAYQVQTVANCTCLYAPPLHEHRNDELLKSKLWVCLRAIFRI